MKNRFQRCITAAVLVATLGHGAVAQAGAAPSLRSNPKTMSQGTRRQFDQGRAAYQAADFAKAGQTFAGALQGVPDVPTNRSVRAFLVVDAMSSYQEAYEKSGNVQMLETGMDVYYAYFKSYRDAYGTSNIPEVVVEARFVMKEALAHARQNGGKPGGSNGDNPQPPPPPDPQSDSTDDGATQPQPVAADRRGDRRRARADADSGTGGDASTPLIASGATMLALGVGASSMIAVGAIQGQRIREDQKQPGYSDEQRERMDEQGKQMNAVFIAGLVVTPVLLATGSALLAKGLIDRRKARLSVAPSVTPKFAGVVVRGRF